MNSTPSVTPSSSERSNALPSNLTQSSTISYPYFKFTDEFSDDEYDDSEEEFDVDYSCPECSRPRTNDRWYKVLIYEEENCKWRKEEIRLLINKRYWECLESDEYAINLPQNRGNAKERVIIKSHPKAVYTSRLLPKPLNDKGYSGYGNFAISESEFIKGIGRTIGQLQQLKIITNENSEDSDYVTRAFEQSLSIGNNISNTSKRAKVTNISKAL
ncbi:7165_t:CDS:2 [Cetraspora pellucida]|uniref:7165_t:CDS:1 n=1 Tax=Cetraspora pellucida TaxID=1433469 RepID=A0ACA9LN12_9GLOM|nr:7165_t:CDS:2 [Cetraspora pellucida]